MKFKLLKLLLVATFIGAATAADSWDRRTNETNRDGYTGGGGDYQSQSTDADCADILGRRIEASFTQSYNDFMELKVNPDARRTSTDSRGSTTDYRGSSSTDYRGSTTDYKGSSSTDYRGSSTDSRGTSTDSRGTTYRRFEQPPKEAEFFSEMDKHMKSQSIGSEASHFWCDFWPRIYLINTNGNGVNVSTVRDIIEGNDQLQDPRENQRKMVYLDNIQTCNSRLSNEQTQNRCNLGIFFQCLTDKCVEKGFGKGSQTNYDQSNYGSGSQNGRNQSNYGAGSQYGQDQYGGKRDQTNYGGRDQYGTGTGTQYGQDQSNYGAGSQYGQDQSNYGAGTQYGAAGDSRYPGSSTTARRG